jgi:protein involved in ribonucleotide reduction
MGVVPLARFVVVKCAGWRYRRRRIWGRQRAIQGKQIGHQVGVPYLHRTIHKGNQHTTPGFFNALQTDVHASHTTTLSSVEQVPLAIK